MLNNKAILLESAMNNAFNYVFYESLFEMIKLSRNVFVLWVNACLLLERLRFSCTVTSEVIRADL